MRVQRGLQESEELVYLYRSLTRFVHSPNDVHGFFVSEHDLVFHKESFEVESVQSAVIVRVEFSEHLCNLEVTLPV